MWWIIICCVIGYLIMSIITGILFMYENSDKDASIFGLAWPVSLWIIVLEIICNKIYDKFLK